jgi:misacylated tRNA(Ala) deacylase
VTELLYLSDAYQTRFDARVVAVDSERVALDRTAFYPGGGGQPSDTGGLTWEGRSSRVRSLRKEQGQVWHALEGEGPPVGARVQGEVDSQRRMDLMRTHTAMHILCGVIWRDYVASVTGGNMEPLRGRMDFEFETMRQELVREIEERINAEVVAARSVRTAVLPREQAFEIPDLIRTKINLLPEGIQEVRVVEIVGLDLQADGGTHVRNTAEVGPLRIIEYKSKGAINKRLVVGLEPAQAES